MPAVVNESPRIARRHDLDALRAIAMLLGIALHAMISFVPAPNGWAVTDSQTAPFFKYLMSSIHGFRMPLFFLISGFFTMMLLRKRGLWALLKQRMLRIFVPLVIGMFTIIPAVWAVSLYVGAMTKSTAAAEAEVSIKESGKQPKEVSPGAAGRSCWTIAAVGDEKKLKAFILDGGDVNHREQDGATALHGALLFGQAGTAKLLLDAGADPYAKNQKGESCVDMLSVPWGITKMVAGMVQVPFDQREAAAGRARIASLLQIEDPTPGLAGSGEDGWLMFGLFYFPLTGHLWFLWFLCWLVTGFAACVLVARVVRMPSVNCSWTTGFWRYLVMIPLTMIAMSFMREAGGFGPDTSLGLIPLPAVLAYYALFFGFGAMYFDGTHGGSLAETKSERILAWIALSVALLFFFPLGMLSRTASGDVSRFLSLFSQSTYAWLMTFGLMGVFRHLLSRESRLMRYLSDSSYWLYLVHIPLVIYLQYLVMNSSLSPYIKFPFVCVVASILLLVSYHLFVRFTPIGLLLNGKRYLWRRPVARPQAASPLNVAEATGRNHAAAVAASHLNPQTGTEGGSA